MKILSILLITAFTSLSLIAQDITGKWNGILNVQGAQLRVVFNVAEVDNVFSATMDSPDQKAYGIPVTHTTFEDSKIKFEAATIGVAYNGELKGNEIIGIFKQGGQEFPMNLSREEVIKEEIKRPQEPSQPYAYYSEDLEFQNKEANITLSGTLTLPKKDGIYPVAILISGSGPQDRNEEVLGHKPFLVIADYLTKNGIGVLRYDDRGVGQSKGDFKSATSVDFASDVESAIAYLKTRKEINKNKIGLIGHSEGGLIAPIVASKSEDVNFMVLLAGPGISGAEILVLQQELIAKASGESEEEIEKTRETSIKIHEKIIQSNDDQKLKTDLTNLVNEALESDPDFEIPGGMTKDKFVVMYVDQMSTPWMQYFIKYNPVPTLEQVSCSVLAINGEKDLQVPPQENLTAIEKALKKGGNDKITIKEYPNLNHLFQECKTGLPSEYETIEQTFSPIVLEEMTTWIIEQVK